MPTATKRNTFHARIATPAAKAGVRLTDEQKDAISTQVGQWLIDQDLDSMSGDKIQDAVIAQVRKGVPEGTSDADVQQIAASGAFYALCGGSPFGGE